MAKRTGGICTPPVARVDDVNDRVSKILQRGNMSVFATRSALTVMVDPAAFAAGVRAVPAGAAPLADASPADAFDGLILGVDDVRVMYAGERYSHFFTLLVPESAADLPVLATVRLQHFVHESPVGDPADTAVGALHAVDELPDVVARHAFDTMQALCVRGEPELPALAQSCLRRYEALLDDLSAAALAAMAEPASSPLEARLQSAPVTSATPNLLASSTGKERALSHMMRLMSTPSGPP
jgi:hypothetical protein